MKRTCDRCHHKGITVTSSSPGDGRPRFICQGCGNTWTEGKKPTQGYQNRRSARVKSEPRMKPRDAAKALKELRKEWLGK